MIGAISKRISASASMLTEITVMAFQYLNGRKLRTALTSLAIVFGVALIFAMNLVLPSALDAFKRTMTSTSGAVDLSVSSASGESFSPDQPIQTIRTVNGVQAATGVLRRQITIPLVGSGSIGSASQIELVGVDSATADSVRHFAISDGRFLRPGDTGKAIVPAAIAEIAPQFKVGTTFPLITAGGLKFYTIVGLLAERGNMAAPRVIVSLADAQAAFNQPGLVNSIEVAFQPGVDRDAVSADVQKALGRNFRLNANTSQIDAIASLEIGFAMFNLLGLIALFMGAFLIFNTFRTVVVERRRDLAMLRAIGAERRQLTLMILVESLIQGIGGTVIGLILGYGFAALMASLFRSFSQIVMPGVQLNLQLNPSAVIGAVVLGLLTTLIAGYFPARAAGKVTPLEGLRPATAAQTKRTARWGLFGGVAIMLAAVVLLVSSRQTSAAGALLFLGGMVLAAPGLVLPVARLFSPLIMVWFASEGDLARGNLTRQPGRAAITASTLMIGLAAFILIAAAVNSFDGFIRNLTTSTFTSDVLILPQTMGIYGSVVGADDRLASRLQALPEVQTVGGLRYASSTTNNQTIQVLGIDPDAYPKVSSLDFTQGKPEEGFPALNSGRAAILNSLAASTLKLAVGSDITVQTAEGPQTYHIVGIANDPLSMKLLTLTISQTNLKTDFHKAEDVMLMVNLKAGADRNAALAAINQVLQDYPQFSARLTGEYRDMIINLSVSALGGMYVLGLLILIPATLGLLNTLTINVMERTREIGVVRAVGGSRAQVRRMVLAEALLLGLFGAATGVIAGVAASYGFIAAFSSFGWKMPYQFPLFGIIAAVILAVLLALGSSILPARNAARLDIIRALQYE